MLAVFHNMSAEEATSMDDRTKVMLFGLDEFAVIDVTRVDDGAVRVVIETWTGEGACPECGGLSSRVKDRPLCRVKDLPASGQPAGRAVVAQTAAGVSADGLSAPLVRGTHDGDPVPGPAHNPAA